jgi:hypothetical protein
MYGARGLCGGVAVIAGVEKAATEAVPQGYVPAAIDYAEKISKYHLN